MFFQFLRIVGHIMSAFWSKTFVRDKNQTNNDWCRLGHTFINRKQQQKIGGIENEMVNWYKNEHKCEIDIYANEWL